MEKNPGYSEPQATPPITYPLYDVSPHFQYISWKSEIVSNFKVLQTVL